MEMGRQVTMRHKYCEIHDDIDLCEIVATVTESNDMMGTK